MKNTKKKNLKNVIIPRFNSLFLSCYHRLWSKFQQDLGFSLILLISASLVISFLMFPQLIIRPKEYKLGDIAQRDIKATSNFLVEDKIATERYRQEAMSKVAPIYDYNPKVWENIRNSIHQAFKSLRKAIEEKKLNQLSSKVLKSKKGVSKEFSDKELKRKFENLLNLKLSFYDFLVLKKEKFSPKIEDSLCQLLEPIYLRGVVKSKMPLIKAKNGIVLISNNPLRKQIIFDVERIFSLEEARQHILQQRYVLYNELDRQTAQVILKIATQLLQPNISFDFYKTQQARQEAASRVKPVFYQVKKGEMLVREGERIGPTQLLKLQAQEKQLRLYHKHSWLLFISLNILIFVFLLINKIVNFWLYPLFFKRRSNFIFWIVNILFFVVIARVGLEVADLFSQSFAVFSEKSFIYPLPVCGATMLMTIFTQPQLGLMMAALMAALTTFIVKAPVFFIYLLVGGLWTALELKCCRHRSKLIKVGLELGLIQALMAICITLVQNNFQVLQLFLNPSLAFIGGLVSGIVVLGLTPIVEVIFGYTSDIRLLELANLDQPLLKELMLKAPGTYHHSVVVAQLAEAAAEEIGANPLLTKVAAYYHDIGKLKKPLYFIENQIGVENKHDYLNPSMSALIIMSHVKDGVELAQKYRLGNQIIDIIKQHHGTSLIRYFYHKAKEQDPNVKEEDFRYPGPKPQTKEAGLVMLADAVEAASRSLVDPSPSRIQSTVQKVISNLFLDGQLDECELTLKDIHKIEQLFSKVLIAIFHPRIEYPDTLPKGEKGDSKHQQTEGNSIRNRAIKK